MECGILRMELEIRMGKLEKTDCWKVKGLELGTLGV